MKSLLKKLAPSFLYRVECNICGSRFREPFADFGIVPRQNARCYTCSSLERHRILWRFLNEETDFLKRPVRLLHMAPEPCFYALFEKRENIEYHPGDLMPEVYGGRVKKMDVTDLPYADNAFDLIICNHVLEHIPDDQKAMRELYRVLKPGGMSVVMTPVNNHPKPAGYTNKSTYEDFSITSEEGRLKAFGQNDHVRVYGTDFKERIESVGFIYQEFTYSRKLSEKRLHRYGMQSGEPVLYGLKQ